MPVEKKDMEKLLKAMDMVRKEDLEKKEEPKAEEVKKEEAAPAVTDPAPPFMDPAFAKVRLKVDITPKDKEEYFKCFLADTSYEETLEAFGGKLKLAFRTLTVEENNDVFNQIHRDQELGLARTDISYYSIISMYRLCLSLVSINEVAFHPDINKESFEDNKEETYIHARYEQVQKWPGFKIQGITEVFRYFEEKILQMTEAIQTPDFWKAAE